MVLYNSLNNFKPQLIAVILDLSSIDCTQGLISYNSINNQFSVVIYPNAIVTILSKLQMLSYF